MSWPCYLTDRTDKNKRPGAMWFISLDIQSHKDEITYGEMWADRLSPEFRASGRMAIMWIRLPGQAGDWSPDFKASGSESGWTVIGEPPNCTAMPSVNSEGYFHGWLRNGALTDDCEGRTFPADETERAADGAGG